MAKRYRKWDEIIIESGIKFDRSMLRLKSNAARREYYSRKNQKELKYAVHWGQRKLLLSELEFLVFFWDPDKVQNPIIVYAGAAGGEHIPILPKLVPQIKKLHLYDPSPFHIKESEKIKIYHKKFTNEDALKWSNRDDIFFISDIRTADYKVLTPNENEKKILKDMKMQKEWVSIMNPVEALLKFRLPYPDFGEKIVPYFYGHVFLQPWAPPTSTETRLVPI